jgi:pimeloyl-ACP methyl ester carboxylesterase
VTETRLAPAGVIVAGPPGAPSIVFVHSTRLTGAMWAAQQAELSGEFQTIAIDLPAHGARAGEPFTLDGAVDVLAAAIRDHATGGRAVVVGLSLGGYVAMALASREPALVRGLVLSGATVEPVGARSLAFLAFASVLDRLAAKRLDLINAWFFRTRYPPALAEPIISGGFWSKGGAHAVCHRARFIVGHCARGKRRTVVSAIENGAGSVAGTRDAMYVASTTRRRTVTSVTWPVTLDRNRRSPEYSHIGKKRTRSDAKNW